MRHTELQPHFQKMSPLRAVLRLRKVLIALTLVGGGVLIGVMGHRAWEAGQAGVQQAALLNQGNQLAGAAHLHKTEQGATEHELAHLRSEGYLSEIPSGWQDGEGGTHAERPDVSVEVCKRINLKVGLVGEKRVVAVVQDPLTEQTAHMGCNEETRTVFFKY